MNQSNKQNRSPLVVILHIALCYWYIFALSLGIFVTAGYIYSQSITKQYSAGMKILIKGQDNSDSPDSGILEELGVSQNTNSVESEMVILKSTTILSQVVDVLNLQTTYTVRPELRNINIYGANPIDVEWIGINGTERIALAIELTSAETFNYRVDNEPLSTLNNITSYFMPKPSEGTLSAKYGDTITVSNVKFVATPTQFWGNQYTTETIRVDLTPMDWQVGYLRRSIMMYQEGRAGTIYVGVNDSSPRRAEDILTALITTYNLNAINKKKQIAIESEQFIANRISLIHDDLVGYDTRVESIKRHNNVTDLGSAGSTKYQQKTRYDDELNVIELQISLIESVRNDINSSAGSFKLIPPNKLFTDVGISEQVTIYNTLATKLLDLSQSSGERNPVYISLRQEVELARENLKVATDNLYRSLQLQRSNLQKNSQRASSQLSSYLGSESAVNDVMREQSIKEQLYLYLLNKREANAIQLSIAEENAIIIEPAASDGNPIYPNVMFLLLVSAVVGMALPGMVLLLTSSSDNKIRSKEYIEEHCEVPVLGIVIKKPKEYKDQDVVVSEDKNEVIGEVFRMICAELDLFNASITAQPKDNQKASVIQVLSGLEGEGKTFTSLNLALAYAFTGKRVLLMDGDLRRKRLSKLLNVTDTGYDRYLYGDQMNLNSIINRSEYSKNLDYIGLGAAPTNPTSLLMSQRFDDMVEGLRDMYDYIIIDSTPYFVIADSKIINRVADNTIWVMRSGVTRKNLLGELSKIYQESKLKNLTAILTDVDVTKKQYNYNYSYTYNYDYVYGENRKKKKK